MSWFSLFGVKTNRWDVKLFSLSVERLMLLTREIWRGPVLCNLQPKPKTWNRNERWKPTENLPSNSNNSYKCVHKLWVFLILGVHNSEFFVSVFLVLERLAKNKFLLSALKTSLICDMDKIAKSWPESLRGGGQGSAFYRYGVGQIAAFQMALLNPSSIHKRS